VKIFEYMKQSIKHGMNYESFNLIQILEETHPNENTEKGNTSHGENID
jgi:hypothetical protein